MKAPSPTPLLIATRNRHKVGEIRAILGNAFDYRTLADYPAAPAVVEDAATFAGNAAKKAETLASWLQAGGAASVAGMAVLADDSGLEVDALGGAPGVHSARFAALDTGAAGNSPDADNNAKLLSLLAHVPPDLRAARFRCVIAFCRWQGGGWVTNLFDGACEGRIDLAPRGAGGFGYDPLFVPEGFDRSFAELGETEKNRISHRARALARLAAWLQTTGR